MQVIFDLLREALSLLFMESAVEELREMFGTLYNGKYTCRGKVTFILRYSYLIPMLAFRRGVY